MYMPGDKPKNYDAMIKRANKEIHKTYKNINLKMNFIGWGDYEQKYNVMVTSVVAVTIWPLRKTIRQMHKGAADMNSELKSGGVANKAYKQVDSAYWKGLRLTVKHMASQSMPTFTRRIC